MHRNDGSACRCLLRHRIFTEISVECLHMCITHHPDSLTTTCLTSFRGSSFAFYVGPDVDTTHKFCRAKPQLLITVMQLTTVFHSVELGYLIENYLLLLQEVMCSVYFTQTTLLQSQNGVCFHIKGNLFQLLKIEL